MPAVLERARLLATEAFEAVGHGGLEAGGVLFGRRSAGCVRIKQLRPLAISYARGPSFLLSDDDEAKLTGLLDDASGDPELAGLAPVGLYVSHARGGLEVLDRDRELFDRHFSSPGSVLLVLKPAKFQPTVAGFWYRARDGEIRGSSESILELAPLASAGSTRASGVAPVEAEIGDVAPEPTAIPAADPPSRGRSRARTLVLACAGVTMAAIGFVAGGWLLGPVYAPQTLAEKPLELAIEDAGSHMLVRWNPTATAVRDAVGGAIRIVDGSQPTIDLRLTPGQLKTGGIKYVRQVARLEVTLSVTGPRGPHRESIVYLAADTPQVSPADTSTTPSEAPSAPAVEAPAQVADREGEVAEAKVQPRVLILPRTAPRQPAAVPAPPLLELNSEVKTAPLVAASGFGQPPPPSPVIDADRVRAAESLTHLPGTRTDQDSRAPQRSDTLPRSGRLLWTGHLPKGGYLLIEGSSSSAGALTGSLPNQPIAVSVFPADLVEGGVQVFTADPRHSRDVKFEPPGPLNGWNPTVFRYDAKRANSIMITTAPAADNGWSKLLIHSRGGPQSMIVVEWRAMQP
jgi:hypothetical protein